MSNERSHCFTITLFNHESVEELHQFWNTLPSSLEFWVAGNEMTKQDPPKQHWQCACRFKNAQRLNSMMKKCGRQHAHVEIMRGTWSDQERYCMKEDPNALRMLDATGQPKPWPKQGDRGDLAAAAKCTSIREHIASDMWNLQSLNCLNIVLAYQRPLKRSVTLTHILHTDFDIPEEEQDVFLYTEDAHWSNYDGETTLICYSDDLPLNIKRLIQGRPCRVLAAGWGKSRPVCITTIIMVWTSEKKFKLAHIEYPTHDPDDVIDDHNEHNYML